MKTISKLLEFFRFRLTCSGPYAPPTKGQEETFSGRGEMIEDGGGGGGGGGGGSAETETSQRSNHHNHKHSNGFGKHYSHHNHHHRHHSKRSSRSCSGPGWSRNKKPGAAMACTQCLLTLVAFKIWILGCIIIGYVGWVLGTSVTIRQFLSGSLVFTYVAIGAGFLLFFTGLLGWVGTSSYSTCILKLFILTAIVTVISEVGGLVTVKIMKLEMNEILQHGWTQVNQQTRNVIQRQMICCGFTGPKEFAYLNAPIDDTCYLPEAPKPPLPTPQSSSSTTPAPTSSSYQVDTNRGFIKNGCGKKLQIWFHENKMIWGSVLAGVAVLQVIGVVLAFIVINRAQHLRRTEIAEQLIYHNPRSSCNHR